MTRRFLLVEDETAYCEFMRIALMEDFVECKETLNEGLQAARMGGWDAIILDLGLECGPDYTIEKIPELAGAGERSTPVIILSGWSTAELVRQAKSAGAAGYVSKEDLGRYGAEYLCLHLDSVLRAENTKKTINEMQESIELAASDFRRLRKMNADARGH